MTRTIAHLSPLLRPMADSVNWAAIPVDEPLVAGYVPPSHFAWPAAAWRRFPNSRLVRITPSAAVFGPGIQVLDIETGDARPDQAPGWAVNSRRAGQEGTSYCSMSLWATVIRCFTGARVPVSQFWVAGYPGGGGVLPSITVDGVTYTAVAHQFADPNTSGGDFDRSVVAKYWPGVDGGGTVELIDALPDPRSVAGEGSVREALTAVLYGIGGRRFGGSLADAVTAIQGDLGALADAVTALQGDVRALSANDASVLGAIQAADADVKAGVAQLVTAVSAVQGGQAPTDAQVQAIEASLAAALRVDVSKITLTVGMQP